MNQLTLYPSYARELENIKKCCDNPHFQSVHNRRMKRLHRRHLGKLENIKPSKPEIEKKSQRFDNRYSSRILKLRDTVEEIKKNQNISIFLSHCWSRDTLGRDNHTRVLDFNRQLQNCGYQTWVDETHLKGHIVQSMCQGLDNCNLVLVCITRAYIEKCKKKENDNCKLELDYAYHRKGTTHMLPIVMEESCNDTSSWDGPVGAYLGQHLYLNYQRDSKEMVSNVLKRLSDFKIDR